MPPVDKFTRDVHTHVSRLMGDAPDKNAMLEALSTLSRWRSHQIGRALLNELGPEVRSGPFEGMTYNLGATEGSFAPRLLGGYEASLHPVIEAIIAAAYPTLIDIGCAEGYYTVGFARRMPSTQILAYDTDPAARESCAALAQANGVAKRVLIKETFTPADLAVHAGRRYCIFCDTEGAEETLLDPTAKGIADADILVEAHDLFRPGVTARLTEKFAPTHEVRRIDRTLAPDSLPDWANTWDDLDRLLALWEWRSGPTPWLWMTSRAQA